MRDRGNAGESRKHFMTAGQTNKKMKRTNWLHRNTDSLLFTNSTTQPFNINSQSYCDY